MATLRAYANGLTMGIGNAAPVGGMRGEVVGWSAAAVRRHKRWLYSVRAGELDGQGDAVTLTLRDCPATHEDWGRLRHALLVALAREGFTRWHWVTEWQRRGVPHVHLAVYSAQCRPGLLVVRHWLRIAAAYGALGPGQVVTPITGPVGWLKYLSKHAARGVRHYQRWGKPEGWVKTGRLWGYGGSWPTPEPEKWELDQADFWVLRRWVRNWAVADAKRRGDLRSVSYLRGMLRATDQRAGAIRGVSEWVPQEVAVRMVEAIVRARKVSLCPVCGQDIQPGQEIRVGVGAHSGSWVHAACRETGLDAILARHGLTSSSRLTRQGSVKAVERSVP
jgi:hypothetical protein